MQLAAGRTLPALPPVTLPTIPALLAKWAARPQSVVDRHKAAWNKDKRRFLLLLSFSQTDRELILTSMQEGASRTNKTKEKWFSAVCAAARDIDIPVTREMAAHSAVLRFMALQEAPSRPTAPLTPTDATQLSKMLTERNLQGLATAVGIAFLLGQRMGDVMNLGTNALCVVHDLASNVWMIALTFRETKTSRVTQPYSLHILRDSPEGQQLMNLQQEQLRKKATHLFGDPLTRLDDYKRIVDVMRLIDKDYSILSIRRGGLQLMSLMGLSIDCILAHSRHRRRETLERYLGFGQVLLAPARERFNLALLPREQMDCWALARQGTILNFGEEEGDVDIDELLTDTHLSDSPGSEEQH